MMMNARNGTVIAGDMQMDYVCFGEGDTSLIMLPGVGDSFFTVKGMAIPLAMGFRMYGRAHRVYVFSRRRGLPPGFTTRDMAQDVAWAMDALHIPHAAVMGVSQGGMIAQHVALCFPQRVTRLILAVTAGTANETMRSVVGRWIEWAQQGDYTAIMKDTFAKSYSKAYYSARRPMYAMMSRIGKPKDFSRFLVQAESCLTHDALNLLGDIACPTLVIGGEDDQIVTGHASVALARRIAGSTLRLYPGLGHGAYDEAKDFHACVAAFLRGDAVVHE